MALVMPAIAGIAFAACTVAFLVVGPNRDISDHALLQGRTSLIEASLLAFELPARRIVNFLFVAFFAACSAWLATLALWRYFHGDRLAVAAADGLTLHPTYSRTFLSWSQIAAVESVGLRIGWLELPAVRVTALEPVKAWLRPAGTKITISPLRSADDANAFAKVAEELRQAATRS